MRVTVYGNNNTFGDFYENYPSQQELDLESLDQNAIPVKFTRTEIEQIKEEAKRRGIGVSKFIRDTFRAHTSIMPKLEKLKEDLDDI